MTTVITLDPALKKLIDELPREDPDKKLVTVWSPWCEGMHLIPLNEVVDVDFGQWFGPVMEVVEIPMRCRYLIYECNVKLDAVGPSIIYPMDSLSVEIMAVLK